MTSFRVVLKWTVRPGGGDHCNEKKRAKKNAGGGSQAAFGGRIREKGCLHRKCKEKERVPGRLSRGAEGGIAGGKKGGAVPEKKGGWETN